MPRNGVATVLSRARLFQIYVKGKKYRPEAPKFCHSGDASRVVPTVIGHRFRLGLIRAKGIRLRVSENVKP